MSIKLFNTLTNRIDKFEPLSKNEVKIYSCGPTVYNKLHVGNWASYIYWDTLVRILTANDYKVNRVINITDVGHLTSDADEGEDKIEKGAHQEGKTAWEIASIYTDDFLKNSKLLNLIEPQHVAKATDFIPEQLDIIRRLKEKGYTYQTSDGIYFDTSRFSRYVNFAHLHLGSQKSGARIEENHEKRQPWDFALWKFSPINKKRDMEWATPADLLDTQNQSITVSIDTLELELEKASGPLSGTTRSSASKNYNRIDEQDSVMKVMGFPGWHLECSAIAMKLLGDTIDIHTGGIDHIPVHHTNEIAQSEATTDTRYANYWLHNNFLKVDGTKISKSLGNGYNLEDLKKRGYTPMDFRMFVLQGHYKNEGNFTFSGLEAAKNRLKSWRNVASIRHQTHDTIHEDEGVRDNEKSVSLYATPQAIVEAISNDLGTPEALKIIDEAFSNVTNSNLDKINRNSLVQLVESIDELLGLNLIQSTPDISDDAKQIVLERKQARLNKQWEKSDQLRDKLLKLGVKIRDTASDTIWEYIN